MQIRCFFVLFLGLLALPCTAQNQLNGLIAETQKFSTEADAMRMVWWIPTEYWAIAIQSSNANKEQEIAEIQNILGDYTLIAIIDGSADHFGQMSFNDYKTIKETLEMLDPKGRRRLPLDNKNISYEAKTFVELMKPSIASTLGKLGKQVHFYLFPGSTEYGEPLVNATEEGAFSLRLHEENFEWKLPIGALLAQKKCPVDGQLHNGGWEYCPYHGSKLIEGEN